MNNRIHKFVTWSVTVSLFGTLAGAGDAASTSDVYPLSDPENKGRWVLNKDVSDEFNGSGIDRDKWFIEGQDGGDYYIWKGRPPSQFVPENVIVEDGLLKIRSQWEPDYPFIKESYADGSRNDSYGVHEGEPLPVTTAAVITKKRFLYGYMEVRTKAANSNMTSSFWAIGYESELDIYEQCGNPKVKDGDIQGNTWKASIHDRSPPAKRPTRRFGLKTKLPFRVADDFHVWAAEWGEDYLKLFLDGELMYETTREKEGKSWVLNNPLEIWFDSEIFVWLGLPHKEELPEDYLIDYVRVWQKPHPNLLARQLFGFEGPILNYDYPIPLDLVPESSESNEYQQFWEIGEHGLGLFMMSKEQSAKGIKSLKFTPHGMLANVSVVSPRESVDIPAGEFDLSMQVFLTEDCDINALNVSLADPELLLEPFDLTGVKKGEWVILTQRFDRGAFSGPRDRLRLRILKQDVTEGVGAIYIYDISIEAAE